MWLEPMSMNDAKSTRMTMVTLVEQPLPNANRSTLSRDKTPLHSLPRTHGHLHEVLTNAPPIGRPSGSECIVESESERMELLKERQRNGATGLPDL